MKRINLRLFLLLMLMLTASAAMYAQRHTDNLNRGLVAVVPRNGQGIFLSWRIQPNEYYDVTYNVYRNNAKIASNLNVSNYFDASGNASYTYRVEAVDANGNVIEPASTNEWNNGATAKVFSINPSTYASGAPAYLSIPLQPVVDRNGTTVYTTDNNCTWKYTPNDACLADIDGDGEIEIILKRINQTDAGNKTVSGVTKQLYETSNTTAYTIIEAYKLNGTRLWWIDCGPNMISLNSTEINCVAYDWDEDGKAEVLMRGADNMRIHTNDGRLIYVGDNTKNHRDERSTDSDANGFTKSQYAWTHTGKEYLLYLNGQTAQPLEASRLSENVYTPMEFPLRRIEGYTDEQLAAMTYAEQIALEENQWECNYGHKSSKYFFGAPFLDGKKASIFLARGIYTQTKMIALDVNSDHSLSTKWTWTSNGKDRVWYGQGNHNMTIADVDGDGCDEIVYGSMTIDNNGKGLSTTGLGHGDAMHVSDLDPYRKGLEVFACNEDNPANNYRDATTSEILFRTESVDDDGRALMGNFTNSIPGCIGRSNSLPVYNLISATSCNINTEIGNIDGAGKGFLNGRIYWDGDLLEEYYASTGTEGDCAVAKPNTTKTGNDNRVMQTSGCKMNNDTKNNPCAQGDIIGDWREELIFRSADNSELRIYSTDNPTEYRIPSLWYDHQYRQGMVWQPCAYNQPPHVSFYLGEMEGITRAPLPVTDNYEDFLDISTNQNGKRLRIWNFNTDPTRPETVYRGVEAGAYSPEIIVANISSIVAGNDDNNNITRATNGAIFGHSERPGDLTGSMRLVKQGGGMLKMNMQRPYSYFGDTEIWDGSMSFHGTWTNSNVWMNRHTELYFGGRYTYDGVEQPAEIKQSLTMEYGATLRPAANEWQSTPDAMDCATATINELNMHEGSRIVFQYGNEGWRDNIAVRTLNVRTQKWKSGPKYIAPVFEIAPVNALSVGRYKLGNIANVNGSFYSIVPECNDASKLPANCTLTLEREGNGDVYLVVNNVTGTIGRVPRVAYLLDFNDYTIKDGKTTNNTTPQYITFKEKEFKDDGSYDTTDANTSNLYKNRKENTDETPYISCHSTYQYFYAYSNNQGGDRIADIAFYNKYFYNSNDYELEFDWGFVPSNDSRNPSKTTIKTPTGVLFYITTEAGSSTSKLYKADGTWIADLQNEGTNPRQAPTKLTHFKITSNSNGTYLNATYQGTTKVNDVKLSNNVEHISAIKTILGRTYSHLAIDDIKLTVYEYAATLSESVSPTLAQSTYDNLSVTRTLNAGYYNTICVPFSTTAEELVCEGARAFTFKEAVTVDGGGYKIKFAKASSIEPNRPYLIYVPGEKMAQVAVKSQFENIAVKAPISVIEESGGWKFISNYKPNLPPATDSYENSKKKYILAEDKLWKCGTSTFLNGMRAYFVSPISTSSSNAPKLIVSFGDDDDEESEATGIVNAETDNGNAETIYSLSGIRQQSIQKGINIIRTNSGVVKKVIVK